VDPARERALPACDATPEPHPPGGGGDTEWSRRACAVFRAAEPKDQRTLEALATQPNGLAAQLPTAPLALVNA
jgi:hypothetical protein